MYHKLLFAGLITFLTIHLSLAQNACDIIIQTAIETASENCNLLRLNQACYGNTLIDAEAAVDVENFQFNKAGDTANLADILSIRLSSNIGNGDWGISLMQVRASLADEIEDNVTILLFGDVAVENAVTVDTINVVANVNTRLRRTPDSTTDLNIIEAVALGSPLTAFGRSESGEWLRVRTNGIVGWVASLLVDGDSERMSLPVVDFSAPFIGPMQAFYISDSGANQASCENIPPDGIIIQTPEGAGTIDFMINEVRLSLGSTAFISLDNNVLSIALLEGLSTVTALGTEQFVPAGTQTTVALNEDGRSPSSPPTDPIFYDVTQLQSLTPLIDSLSPAPISIQQPNDNTDVETYIDEVRGTIQPRGGIWSMTLESVLTVEDTLVTQQGVAGCTLNAQVGFSIVREFPFDADAQIFDGSALLSPGIYGASDVEHNRVLASANDIELSFWATTTIFNSDGSFSRRASFRNHWIGGGTGESYKIACIQYWRGTWVGPS